MADQAVEMRANLTLMSTLLIERDDHVGIEFRRELAARSEGGMNIMLDARVLLGDVEERTVRHAAECQRHPVLRSSIYRTAVLYFYTTVASGRALVKTTMLEENASPGFTVAVGRGGDDD